MRPLILRRKRFHLRKERTFRGSETDATRASATRRSAPAVTCRRSLARTATRKRRHQGALRENTSSRIGCTSSDPYFRNDNNFCKISAISMTFFRSLNLHFIFRTGSCHKRQKPQAPTPQAPIRNRQTKKVSNAKGLNRNANLT